MFHASGNPFFIIMPPSSGWKMEVVYSPERSIIPDYSSIQSLSHFKHTYQQSHNNLSFESRMVSNLLIEHAQLQALRF